MPIVFCPQEAVWGDVATWIGALGTIAVSALALYFSQAAHRREQERDQRAVAEREDRASRYAVIFDHEIYILYAQLCSRAAATTPDAFARDPAYAMKIIVLGHREMDLPLVDRFADQLGVFEPIVAMKLGVLLSGIIQMRKSPPSEWLLNTPHLRPDVAETTRVEVHKEAIVMLKRAHEARLAIRPAANKLARLLDVPELPEWIPRD